MGRLARVALVAGAAAAAYGARLWQQNREGKDIWATATDDLPEDAEGVAALAWLPQRVAGTDVLLVAVGARLVAVCAT